MICRFYDISLYARLFAISHFFNNSVCNPLVILDPVTVKLTGTVAKNTGIKMKITKDSQKNHVCPHHDVAEVLEDKMKNDGDFKRLLFTDIAAIITLHPV